MIPGVLAQAPGSSAKQQALLHQAQVLSLSKGFLHTRAITMTSPEAVADVTMRLRGSNISTQISQTFASLGRQRLRNVLSSASISSLNVIRRAVSKQITAPLAQLIAKPIVATFVNTTGASGAASVTSKTIPIPSSPVAGNLLIGWVRTSDARSAFTISGGSSTWNILTVGRDGKFCVAWTIAVGSDTSPTVSWTGGSTGAAYSECLQFSGVNQSAPIGNYGILTRAPEAFYTQTNLVGAPVIASQANGMIVAFLCNNGVNSTPPLPTGYTSAQATPVSDSWGSVRSCYQTSKAVECDPIAVAVSANNWESVIVELCGNAAATPLLRAQDTNVNWTDIHPASGTTATGLLPSNRQSGDILICFAANFGANTTYSFTSSGWTLGDNSTSAGGPSMAWGWARVTGSEVAPTVSFGGSSVSCNMFTCAIARGKASGTPTGQFSKAQGGGTLVNLTGLSGLTANSLVVGCYGAQSGGMTIPAHYIDGWSDGGGAIPTMQLNNVMVASNLTATVSSGNWVAMLIEVLAA